MPVSIGDVQSEVLVEPSGGQTPAQEGKTLPTHEELDRLRQMVRRQTWDNRRTCAYDFDD